MTKKKTYLFIIKTSILWWHKIPLELGIFAKVVRFHGIKIGLLGKIIIENTPERMNEDFLRHQLAIVHTPAGVKKLLGELVNLI